jgi:hypothetical protein
MNRSKLITAGICGAVVLLVLTVMGVVWYWALAVGFAVMVAGGLIARNSN